MDNVTKALVISGAVLVSILLVATGVYVVNTQNPELFAKKATDTMWEGVGLGEGEEVEEYEDMGENVEVNTEGGSENSTTYLKSQSFLSRTSIELSKVEKLTFIDTNKHKAKEGALIEADVGATKNGEIMAYAYDNDGNELYEVVIAQAGGVKANPNCYLFLRDANNLKEINLKYLDTANVTDMSSMFGRCSSLKSLDLSNFNTANVTDMSSMFGVCSGLTSLKLSKFNTANVTDMSSMFVSCSSLKSLDVGNFNTENVKKMNNMFEGCSGLTSLNLSNFNTANVTNMNVMFMNCSELTSLDLNNFNTANVTDMSHMFRNCSNLTSLNVSNFKTGNVKGMSNMFMSCYKLEEIDLSGWDTSKVTDMSNMFMSCYKLEEIDLSGWDTSKVTDMSYMFYGENENMALKKLDLSNWNTESVTTMSRMFNRCKYLEELILGENFIIKESTNTNSITTSAHANAKAVIKAKLPVTE